MRKITAMLLVMLALILLAGCGKNYRMLPEPSNQMVVTVPKELTDNLVYQGYLPKLSITFTDNINVATFSTDNYYVLTKNNDFTVSSDLALFLATYTDQSIIYKISPSAAETDYGRLGGKKLPLDEPSFEYNQIITTEDGTRYSFQYRKFSSDGVTYYGWTYANGISVSMELPLMLSKINDTRFLYLLSLPYDTRYEVSANLELDKLLTRDTYLDPAFYTFLYPDALKDLSLPEKEAKIKEWYTLHNEGRTENGQYVINYLGIEYIVSFDKKKLNKDTQKEEDAFSLSLK